MNFFILIVCLAVTGDLEKGASSLSIKQSKSTLDGQGKSPRNLPKMFGFVFFIKPTDLNKQGRYICGKK